MSGFTRSCPECMHDPHFVGCKTGTIDRLMTERNRLVATTDLGALSERLEEDNAATDAKLVRSAMHELERLRGERAAIVAWLRELPPPWDERVDPETVSMWCADRIEDGEHLKTSTH